MLATSTRRSYGFLKRLVANGSRPYDFEAQNLKKPRRDRERQIAASQEARQLGRIDMSEAAKPLQRKLALINRFSKLIYDAYATSGTPHVLALHCFLTIVYHPRPENTEKEWRVPLTRRLVADILLL
jgi:hypothetical protein